MVLVEDDLEYEINEKGERVLIRSVESSHPIHIRFRNLTRRDVDILWRDYHGRPRRYIALQPGSHYDVNTFATHPWQFEDSRTKERYVINNRPIFRPPANLPPQFRTNWNITIGVRTLRHTALLRIALLLKDPKHTDELDLPNMLTDELNALVVKLNSVARQPESH